MTAPWTAGYLSLREIQRLPRNPKDHDIGAIIESILSFGYVEPIVVNAPTHHLVHGHGRDDALAYLHDHPDALKRGGQLRKGVNPSTMAPWGIVVDDGEWRVPLFFVDIPEWREEALTIALNRTTELGGWDEQKLAEILGELAKAGEDAIEGIGFSDDDIDLLLRGVQFPQLDDAELPEDYEHEARESVKIKIGNPDYVVDAIVAIKELLAMHPEWRAEIVG